jgi:hypothetical protein
MTRLFDQGRDAARLQRDAALLHELESFPHGQRQAIQTDDQFRDDFAFVRSSIGRIAVCVHHETRDRPEHFDVADARDVSVVHRHRFVQRYSSASHSQAPVVLPSFRRPSDTVKTREGLATQNDISGTFGCASFRAPPKTLENFRRLNFNSVYRVSHPRAGSANPCCPGAAFVEGRATSPSAVERHASALTRGVSQAGAPHFLSIAGPHQRTADADSREKHAGLSSLGCCWRAGERARGTVQ